MIDPGILAEKHFHTGFCDTAAVIRILKIKEKLFIEQTDSFDRADRDQHQTAGDKTDFPDNAGAF